MKAGGQVGPGFPQAHCMLGSRRRQILDSSGPVKSAPEYFCACLGWGFGIGRSFPLYFPPQILIAFKHSLI